MIHMKFHHLLKQNSTAILTIIGLLLCAFSGRAQTQVFSEDWETDHSSDNTYVTNYTTGGANLAFLYFDYSTAGIPQSPHSTGQGTHALKLCANLDSSVQIFPSGVSVSPAGFGITENFIMHWDGWWNYNGPFTGGGSGSTQIGGAGYGTAGTTAQVAGVADSVYIGGSTDGNTTSDFRVYSTYHPISYQNMSYRVGSDGTNATTLGDPTSGFVYAGDGGSRDSDVGGATGYYETNFPSQQCPSNQFLLFPQQTNSNGTLAGAPGFNKAGALCFKWHDVSLEKIANVIRYRIDGVLIATVDVVDAGPLGGTNILFNHYDINTGASTDPNRTNLIFTLVDNVRITNFPNVVSVSNAVSSIAEGDSAPGTFVVTRTSSGIPLTVNYSMTGTAQNGVDYTNAAGGPLSGSVTFTANATSTNIQVFAVDDTIPETTETITLNIDPSTNYTGAGNATIRIVDNETPQLVITNIHSQMYERTNDFATFQITRLGSTNVPSFLVLLSYSGGTASFGTDFYVTNTALTFEPGVQTTNISVFPIEDGIYEGNETAFVNIGIPGGNQYTIGSPGSASITIVDADGPPETVLFSDNFNTDSSANWNLFFADTNNQPVQDYSAFFAFDYSGQGIPPAPHGSGDTLGLFLSVNKDATPTAAALNLYPVGQNFSGNFALKFDMFLDILPGGSSTEYALFGINHSGTKTNWWRSGGVPDGWSFDGIFYAIETDAQSVPNFVNYSSPTANNNPTALTAGVNSSAFTTAFKSPPWVVAGSPAMCTSSNTPVWSDVELSKIGDQITLRINKTTIFSYTNTTPYTSGNIMLGYEDAFDSTGPAQNYVVYDNVRVISLAGPVITAINRVGANVQIDFTTGAANGDVPAQFALQSAAVVAGPYGDTSATITSLGGGNFRATKPFDPNAPAVFYRVRRAF
jgi:hypothetical protein